MWPHSSTFPDTGKYNLFVTSIRRDETHNITGIRSDPKANKDYIVCELNSSEGNARSPYSLKFYPEDTGSYYATPKIKHLEKEINMCYDKFCKDKYLRNTSSIYVNEGGNVITFVLFMRKLADNLVR